MWYKRSGNHKKNKKKKTVFGGTIKSQKEIRDLHNKIEKKHADDFAQFKKEFEANAESVWGDNNDHEPSKQPTDSQTVRTLSAKEKLMILSKLQLNLKKILQKQKAQ